MQDSEILRYAVDNDMLDITTIKAIIAMNNRKKYLKNHPYSVFEGADGYWHTYIPLENGKRKAVKKKTKEAIEDAIVEYQKDDEYTFEKAFNKWMDRQAILGRSENTIYKYDADYKRFLKGSEFEQLLVDEISELSIANYLKDLLEHKDVKYRALKGLFGYIKGVLDMCVREKQIDENVTHYIDLIMFKKYCARDEIKTNDERILTDYECKMLIDKIEDKISKKPSYIPQYAVLLSIYTGMRVGELSALKWSDIDYEKRYLIIQRSEKQNRKDRSYSIEDTKNHKIRTFPITDEILSVLDRVKRVEFDNGWLNEWVFSNENGKIHNGIISDHMRNATLYDKRFKTVKSIHSNRRTLNSKLRCSGVSATVASSLLGHTERVNELNYTYDVTQSNYKLAIVEQANKR